MLGRGMQSHVQGLVSCGQGGVSAEQGGRRVLRHEARLYLAPGRPYGIWELE